MKLEIRNASFGYGSKQILKDLDLAVPENEVLTILGPNGVGKTTLLKCMMGFLKWSRGCTMLDGKPLRECSEAEVWGSVSYVPQAKHNPFSYSILDTVVMGLNAGKSMFSSPSTSDYDRAYATLEKLDIADIAHQGCNEVSGGQLQMALIARALVSDPKILILDEPESNLDMRNQLKVLGAIERIAATRETTVIVNTHYPEHALSISNNTLFLGKCGMRLMGPSHDVITEENIDRYYGVRAKVVPVETDLGQMRTILPFGLSLKSA